MFVIFVKDHNYLHSEYKCDCHEDDACPVSQVDVASDTPNHSKQSHDDADDDGDHFST